MYFSKVAHHKNLTMGKRLQKRWKKSTYEFEFIRYVASEVWYSSKLHSTVLSKFTGVQSSIYCTYKLIRSEFDLNLPTGSLKMFRNYVLSSWNGCSRRNKNNKNNSLQTPRPRWSRWKTFLQLLVTFHDMEWTLISMSCEYLFISTELV